MVGMDSRLRSLSARANNISENNKSNLLLIARLGKAQYSTEAQSGQDGGDEDARVDFTAEVHEALKLQEEEFELLDQEVRDVLDTGHKGHHKVEDPREREKTNLTVAVTKLKEDLKQSRAEFRKAQLQAKRSAELTKQQERDMLFSSIRDGGAAAAAIGTRKRGQDKLSADDLLVNASTDVTAALRQTQRTMQAELERSRFAQETLEQSTEQLASLSEKYSGLDDLLASSKTLVTTLVRSNKSDTWYLETAFYILCATIAWLLFRRLLYGPLWWFVYLPLRLLYRFCFGLLSTLGLVRGGGAAMAAVSSVSTSLIVKQSATARPPPINDMARNALKQGIPVGRGGRGYAEQGVPSRPQSMAQRVGKIVDGSTEAAEDEIVGSDDGSQGRPGGNTRRGDGELLQESDELRNPYKRMLEENIGGPSSSEADDKDEL